MDKKELFDKLREGKMLNIFQYKVYASMMEEDALEVEDKELRAKKLIEAESYKDKAESEERFIKKMEEMSEVL